MCEPYEDGYDFRELNYDLDDLNDESQTYDSESYCHNFDMSDMNQALSWATAQRLESDRRRKLENEKHKEDAKVRKKALIEWKKENPEIFNKIKSKSYEVHERCYNRIERDIKDAFPDIFKGRERSLEELFDYIKEGFNEDDEEYIFLHFTDPAEDTIDPDYGWIPDNLMQCMFKGYPVCKNIYHSKTIERLESEKKELYKKRRELEEKRRKLEEERRKRKLEKKKLEKKNNIESNKKLENKINETKETSDQSNGVKETTEQSNEVKENKNQIIEDKNLKRNKIKKILQKKKEDEAKTAFLFEKTVSDIVDNEVSEQENNDTKDLKEENIPLTGELLPNWKRHYSKKKNMAWYLNTVTQEKRWKMPLYVIRESRKYPGKYYKINPDDPKDSKWI